MIREEQVLISRRFNTGYEDGNYSVPAGHLDGGEAVRQAMIREAKEELGAVIHPDDLAFVGVFHRRSDAERVDFFFSAQKWVGSPENREPDKCDQLKWFPMNALPGKMVPYIRRAIENFLAGDIFDEFGW